MKNNNDFRWIPCDPSSLDSKNRLGGTASAQGLLLQYATTIAVELAHRGSTAGLDEFALSESDDYPPVIQIG